MAELLGVLVGVALHIGWIAVEEVGFGIILLNYFLIGKVLDNHHIQALVEFFDAFQTVTHTGDATLLRDAEAVTF
jgi:hypothetical protein